MIRLSSALYSESPQPRLRPALAVALLLAWAAGGCSLSLPLDLAGKSNITKADLARIAESRAEYTGSIGKKSKSGADAKGEAEPVKLQLPPDGDLVFARAAVGEVLTRGGKDVSQPWENPRTGARGSVTPLASAYDQDGLACRDFLVSYLRDKAETWLQGEACRERAGPWQVRSLKPWQRS